MIYLDYAANTPVDKRVLKAYNDATIKYIANPNSSHSGGKSAKNKIDNCSKFIANYLIAIKKTSYILVDLLNQTI